MALITSGFVGNQLLRFLRDLNITLCLTSLGDDLQGKLEREHVVPVRLTAAIPVENATAAVRGCLQLPTAPPPLSPTAAPPLPSTASLGSGTAFALRVFHCFSIGQATA